MGNGQLERRVPSLQLRTLSLPAINWDVTKGEAPPELLQAGVELAYFLVSDRSAAIQILTRALDKLRVGSRRELKRLYWRDKHAQRPIRRISRNDVDMLQWLILCETEQEERAEERTGTISPAAMTMHYIKYLVQITTSLSSFYVNVGISRLLHSYSTSEAQRIYERLTSTFLGADEYRRAKSALMDRISQRFAGLVKMTRVDHGELRFETSENQEQFAEVLADSLRAFTPWSMRASCVQFAPANGSEIGPSFPFWGDKANQNEIELRSCHILIHPTCYSRLMQELAFELPEKRLALPRFQMPDKEYRDDNSHPPNPPVLSQEDINQIQRRLAVTDMRRRNIKARRVTIFIDGAEHSQVDLSKQSQLQIELEAGASLIEVRGDDERGELLLATHVISYARGTFDQSRATAALTSGKLKFEVTPVAASGQGTPRAIFSLVFHSRTHWMSAWLGWRDFARLQWPVSAYAIGLATALIGAGITGAIYSHKLKLLQGELQQAQRRLEQFSSMSAPAIISYRLSSDDRRVRGSGTEGIPEISLRLHSPVIRLQLALGPRQGESYKAELKTFNGDQTVLTQNVVRPVPDDSSRAVDVIIPTDLLTPDLYYTVYLHGFDRTDHFTFKVVR
jgi:hypothetical protein